ncbi:MAG: DUF5519 family protein [Actinomycetota bacterium]|nr:DUF5519 family protein [Actinomycetota bacterium]
MSIALPRRQGPRPSTTPTNPHSQLDQQPEEPSTSAALAQRVFALEGVEERPSIISVPGARALCLRDGLPAGPREAFMIGREFAHLHPSPDHSLHMALPPDVVRKAIELGWAELHPVALQGLIPETAVMVYAPRRSEEVDIVALLVEASWRFARGEGETIT